MSEWVDKQARKRVSVWVCTIVIEWVVSQSMNEWVDKQASERTNERASE